jgi:hypothetical protein
MRGHCHRCGFGPRSLHTHHKIPRSQGGTDDPANIEHLCANCHEDEHGGPMGGSLGNRLAHTPEAKAKRSATFRRLWGDPDYRKRQSESRRTSWARETDRVSRTRGMLGWIKANPDLLSARAKKIAAARNAKGLKPGQRIGETDTEWYERVVVPRKVANAERARLNAEARRGTKMKAERKQKISDSLKRAYAEGRHKRITETVTLS